MAAVLLDAPPVSVEGAYRQFCVAFRDLLEAIAEHDRCEAYRLVGTRSEEDWLRRALDLHWTTARDWTREARLLAAHPEIGDRFASGELSVDKLRSAAEVVALTDPDSLAPPGPFDDPGPDPTAPGPDPGSDPGSEPAPDPSPRPVDDPGSDPDRSPSLTLEELLAMLEDLSARQLAAQAAAARAEASRRRERWRTRHLDVARVDGEGRLIIRGGQLYDDDAAVVHAAFEDYASRAGINPETGVRDPIGVRHADALRAMADAYLARRERDLAHPLVVFHADARVLSDEPEVFGAVGADQSPLAVETIRRLVCFSKVNLALDDPDGNPLNLGRTQRLATWQQEYMVIWRDGGCRACGATVGLEVHHLRPWDAELGPTDIDNLVGSCRTCHHLTHDRGWRFEGDPNQEVRFVDPGGIVRSRTRPDPRSHAHRRPPREWLNPPPPDDDRAPARPAETPTLL
jgi:hypothetical protein